MSREILAAGTVCWRRVPAEAAARSGTGTPASATTVAGGSAATAGAAVVPPVDQLMVLLIHRTKQGDVSFPKGKVDPGESMPQAAVRETHEETGLQVSLGLNLGTINYTVGDTARKTVQYWAAEVTPACALASTFTPNREVQALEWVPASRARARLSYKADRELFDVFLRLASHDLLDTFSVTLLRHAKAAPRSPLSPEDHQRPLTTVGDEQAEVLVPSLAAFGPRRIYSSTAVRCLETVAPIAEHLDKRVRANEALSQDFWDAGDLSLTRSLVGKIVKRGKNAIVCSHRPVLPDLARELVLATGSVPGDYLAEATALPPGGFSVFHFSRTRPGAGILGVEMYPFKH
ncbi:8-oxo-dGTP diphosphatase [Leucobacter exalbidus]|uniref:8-oxo-dGTP diphosphatase n=1 Tax=Leucobacter exalbidus TaxID=662960 RepID=A0A940PUF9_9MICO|nr:NUDIX domain-containing protein [Leucobacter exalbidus]MBP1327162.1 8-oxo-dGTP diphosphatase [Leucobacter exalbidus]